MAAPTINFSATPTICKMFDGGILTALTLNVPLSTMAITIGHNAGYSDLVAPAKMYVGYHGNETAAQIPKPPVGKLLIATYPPIYKERTNYKGVADSPRQFPPIYITHLTS